MKANGDYLYAYMGPPDDVQQMDKEKAYIVLNAPWEDITSEKYQSQEEVLAAFPVPAGWCLTNDQMDPCPLTLRCPDASIDQSTSVSTGVETRHSNNAELNYKRTGDFGNRSN